MSGNLKLLSTIIVALFAADLVKSQCTSSQQAPCQCIGPDGMGYDLSRIASLGPFFATSVQEDTKLAFLPCKNDELKFPHINVTSGDCKVASLCLWGKEDNAVNLGTVQETRWEWVLHNPELILTHQNIESHIEIVCSNHLDMPVLSYQNVSGTKYMFQLESNQLCKVDLSPRGLSTGSVLVILFFVFAGVYFIGGMAILTYCRGAIGRESIPNYEFWADLPALVRDGVTFTLSGCSAISYERI